MCHNTNFLTLTCALFSLLLLSACGGSETAVQNNAGTNTSANLTTTSTQGTQTTSTGSATGSSTGSMAVATGSPTGTSKATSSSQVGEVEQSVTSRVKFKGGERWGAELSRGLELSEDALCKEFGRFSCVGLVHKIALGGVEPYKLAVVEPTEVAPVTAPLAVDRVALSACVQRMTLDAQGGKPVIFGPILKANPGREDAAVVVASLYQRLLSRNPSEMESQMLLDSLETFPSAQEWATSSCFALASSTEMLFY